MLVSAEDVSDGELEWALRDEADGLAELAQIEGSASAVIALASGEPSPQLARKLRNLFSEKAHQAAVRELENADRDIRAVALQYMLDRDAAKYRWCMNPVCLAYIEPAKSGKRGRRRLYCHPRCQAAAGVRRIRDRKDPGRADRLDDRFQLPRYVRPGYAQKAGNRRKRAGVFGFDSLITPEIQAQRHHAAVNGLPGAEASILAKLVDPDGSRRQPKREREAARKMAVEALEELFE